ncbi:MAG: iron-sulfur cluster assembly accessory protein [Oligoflexia bacterium]|nr:iron-sulfur cluster assembly accessory protein [Oligoflexia bacterium]
MGQGCCGGGGKSSESSGCCSSSGEPPANGSSGFTGSDDQPIFLTPAAIGAIRNAIKEEGEAGDGLRVSVVGGGCSGYQYNLDFEKEARMGDLSLDFDGVKVFVDSVSAGYLKGTVIDFVSGLQGTGFKFNNPNAKRTCGCGHSFS